MKKTFLSAIAIILTGCVHMNQTLTNDDGRRFTCESTGVGVIASAYEIYRQKRCVDAAKSRGFKEAQL